MGVEENTTDRGGVELISKVKEKKENLTVSDTRETGSDK